MRGYSFTELRDPKLADWERLRDQLYIVHDEQVEVFDAGDLQ
jgi:hypothetical protein